MRYGSQIRYGAKSGTMNIIHGIIFTFTRQAMRTGEAAPDLGWRQSNL